MTEAAEKTNIATTTQSVVDLNGEFHFKVDAKGRMSLPAKFRRVLPKDLVVTLNPEGECLYVFHPTDFNNWVTKIFETKFGGYKESDALHVRLRRKLKSRAKDVEIDASGRIMLSADVRAMIGIEKDAVVIGNVGYFEIWDVKRYQEQDDDTDLGLLFR